MTNEVPGCPRYEYTTTSTFSKTEKKQEKTKWLNLSLDRPLLCPFCNGHPREYQDGLAWTIRCCAVVTATSREKALEIWNKRGGEYDPYHARCPNCGKVGFWECEQTIPTEGEYDYWMICSYCHGTVGIKTLGKMMRHGGERMSIEDHPHVIRSPTTDAEYTAMWPYLLRIPGRLNVALTMEDMLILYATCERLLKEDEE